MAMTMEARHTRFRELNRLTKPELCAMYRELGYIGGLHPLHKWRKDEVIHGIIDQEQTLVEAGQAAADAQIVTDGHDGQVDITQPYVIRVERTDQPADNPDRPPRMLSFETHMRPDGRFPTLADAARWRLGESRASHRYNGPARVHLWNHRGDEEHYRAPVPDTAAVFSFAALPTDD